MVGLMLLVGALVLTCLGSEFVPRLDEGDLLIRIPIAPEQIDFQKGVKLEIICRDSLADEVIATIEKAAHTGLKGDGKIYLSTVGQAVRVSTGERGEGAV